MMRTKNQLLNLFINFWNNMFSAKNTENSFFSIDSYEVHPIEDFVDDYVVFDLETTGLSEFSNEIIEIGALKYKNNKLISKFNLLVKPKQRIPGQITEITGIKNEDVKNADDISIVLPKFLAFIEDYPLIAHNSNFDMKFILINLYRQHIKCISNNTCDTLALARKYIPGLQNYKLETLKKHLKIDTISHRAASDCEVTNAVYQYCKNIKNKYFKFYKNKKGK